MLDLYREYEYMKNDIDLSIQKCLQHQKWILGPEVQELEEKISSYVGARHCIGVSSGTEALVLSLRALAIKRKGEEYFDRNDLIITTPFTFTATGDAILRAGATPAFVDVDPITYNIDPAKIREFLAHGGSTTRGPSNVVGLIPVHLYGRPCEMNQIMDIAKEHRLFVVEDVAQAFGAVWEGKKAGSIGDAGAFSFFPSKNLGGFGDGGMISTNDDEIDRLVRMLIKHGGRDKYNVQHVGYNARLDTIQASVLQAKLKYVNEFNARRNQIAARYNAGLAGIGGIRLPTADQTGQAGTGNHVFHQYTIRVLNDKRDRLKKALADRQIETMVYYPVPLHQMALFDNGDQGGRLREAETAAREVLSLPIEPLMGNDEITSVVDAVKNALK